MQSRTVWFIAAMFILMVLASAAPRIAGGIVVLIVVVLALSVARQGLLSTGGTLP